MITSNALWAVDDENLAVLPRWVPPTGATLTAPFVDTHVAVRFLGGVSNFSAATAADCTDVVGPAAASGVDRPGVWCDLVVRDVESRKLVSRFGLVNSRLDRYAHNGIDVMIVLDDVPWAFVNVTTEVCQPFGCQYLPPDDPSEFGAWVGALAVYLEATYGSAYANRVQWRLGTEANGPRWGDRGKYYAQYLACYVAAMKAVKRVLPGARVGASNWVEVMRPGASGNFTPGGSDSFQYEFYGAVAADASIPLDWISISHYGGAENFPGADYVERTPMQSAGAVELVAMRARDATARDARDSGVEHPSERERARIVGAILARQRVGGGERDAVAVRRGRGQDLSLGERHHHSKRERQPERRELLRAVGVGYGAP